MHKLIVPSKYVYRNISGNAKDAYEKLLPSSKKLLVERYGSYHNWYSEYYMKRYNSGKIGLQDITSWELDYDIEKWFNDYDVEYDLMENTIASYAPLSYEENKKYVELILADAIASSPATKKAIKDMEMKIFHMRYNDNPFYGLTPDESIAVMFKLTFC